jgi:hypothetical protein
MPLHFLRHLLKRCLSDETGESFDLLRHLHFSLGNCEASFRAGSPARMSASALCSRLVHREAAGHSLLAVRVKVVMVHQPNLRLGLKQTL